MAYAGNASGYLKRREITVNEGNILFALISMSFQIIYLQPEKLTAFQSPVSIEILQSETD